MDCSALVAGVGGVGYGDLPKDIRKLAIDLVFDNQPVVVDSEKSIDEIYSWFDSDSSSPCVVVALMDGADHQSDQKLPAFIAINWERIEFELENRGIRIGHPEHASAVYAVRILFQVMVQKIVKGAAM